MSAPARGIPRELLIDDFLRWLEGRPATERWELIDGEPVRSMAPEAVRHVELKRSLLEALRGGLQASGLPCRAFGDGRAVRTGKRSFFQPDASVSGARRIDPDALEVLP
jgi:Uma2 family endonuclease